MKIYYFCEWCGSFYGNKKEADKCKNNDRLIRPRFQKGEFCYFKRELRATEKCKVLAVIRKQYKLKLGENDKPEAPLLFGLTDYHGQEKITVESKIGKSDMKLKQKHFVYKVELLNQELPLRIKILLAESYELSKRL